MNPRTIRDFDFSGDTGPIVDAWAADNKFRLIESVEPKRLYQRGHGFWPAPVRFEVEQQGSRVHLEKPGQPPVA